MFVGVVHETAKIISPDFGGKPFVAFALTGDPTSYGNEGKQFTERVNVKLYPRDIEGAVSEIKAGRLISVFGEASARAVESKRDGGKPFANLEIVTFNYTLEGIVPTEKKSTPPQAELPRAKSSTVKAPPPDEDDVPF